MSDVKRYVAECFGGAEAANRPAVAVFDVNRVLADFIVRMALLVRSNGLVQVERWDSTPTWLTRDPGDDGDCPSAEATALGSLSWSDTDIMPSEGARIAVTADMFLFLCYRRNGTQEFETAEQDIAELARHFGIPFDDPGHDPSPTPAAVAAAPQDKPTVRVTLARHAVDHIEVTVQVDDPDDDDAIEEAAREAACQAVDGFSAVSTVWTIESVVAAA